MILDAIDIHLLSQPTVLSPIHLISPSSSLLHQLRQLRLWVQLGIEEVLLPWLDGG